MDKPFYVFLSTMMYAMNSPEALNDDQQFNIDRLFAGESNKALLEINCDDVKPEDFLKDGKYLHYIDFLDLYMLDFVCDEHPGSKVIKSKGTVFNGQHFNMTMGSDEIENNIKILEDMSDKEAILYYETN